MATYTVIALIKLSSHDFLVAGVIEGNHPCVDTEWASGDWGDYQRYGTSVEAADPDIAEQEAFWAHARECDECEAPEEDDDAPTS